MKDIIEITLSVQKSKYSNSYNITVSVTRYVIGAIIRALILTQSHTIEHISRFKEYFFTKELITINIDEVIKDNDGTSNNKM